MTADAEAEDGEGFFARWSRRKQEARGADAEPEEARQDEVPPEDAPPEDEEEVDPATLPPVDTLGADSDYTVFLKKGVPKAVRLAALRRAWATDPAITGYKTLADYDWDCNAPGYGQLRPDDDARKVTEAMFRHLHKEAARPVEEPDGTAERPAAESGDAPADAEPDAIAEGEAPEGDTPEGGAVA